MIEKQKLYQQLRLVFFNLSLLQMSGKAKLASTTDSICTYSFLDLAVKTIQLQGICTNASTNLSRGEQENTSATFKINVMPTMLVLNKGTASFYNELNIGLA